MKFYLVLSVMAAGLFGGYQASETYRRLDSFHRQYLDQPARLASRNAAVVYPPLNLHR